MKQDISRLAKALLKALIFAARKHRDQRRKDAEASPYINHPIEVAEIIARIGGVDDVTGSADGAVVRHGGGEADVTGRTRT